jgi:hypothetical protein
VISISAPIYLPHYTVVDHGPVCLGIHLAYMELRGGAARFFRAFPNATRSHLENMSDEEMEPKIYFLMVPKGGRCLIQAS